MSTNPEAEADVSAATGNLSPEARRILAQAGVDTKQQPNGQARVGEPEAPMELEVDVGGGVKRRVPRAVLEETYRRQHEIEATKQAVQASLAEMGDLQAVRALSDRISGLDATRRAKVLSLLQNEAESDGGEGDLDDQIVKEAFGSARAGKQPDLRGLSPDRMDRLEQAVQALAALENGRRREQEFTTTGQRVDALMGEFPVFKGNEAARMFAKDSIMSQVASAPKGTPIEEVVRLAAAKLQELEQRAQAQTFQDLGVPHSMLRPKIPDGVLTAKGLKAGSVRQAAMDYFNRQPR